MLSLLMMLLCLLQCVQIQPMTGTLGPLESAMFKVTFTATGFPSFYNLDFTCQVSKLLRFLETIQAIFLHNWSIQVVNSSQLARFESDLAQWESVKAQQEQEFTIIEKNVHEVQRAGSDSQLKSIKMRNPTPPLTPSELDFKRYDV